MKTITERDGKNVNMQVVGDLHQYPDGSVHTVKDGKAVWEEGGGGSGGGTKIYDFSLDPAAPTQYIDKNLTANDFVNAFLRDSSTYPGAIIYAQIINVIASESEGISFVFIDPLSPTATMVALVYNPESGEVNAV